MSVPKAYYQFTSKKLINLCKEVFEEKEARNKAIRKLARKYGAGPGYMDWEGGRFAFLFRSPPDPKIWKKHPAKVNPPCYTPRRNTREGKAVAEEFTAIEPWTTRRIAEAVGWEDIHTDGYWFPFGFFASWNEQFFGMSSPLVSKKKERYKPIKGMKEITATKYAKVFDK